MAFVQAIAVAGSVISLAQALAPRAQDPTGQVLLSLSKNLEAINAGIQATLVQLAEIDRKIERLPATLFSYNAVVKITANASLLISLTNQFDAGVAPQERITFYRDLYNIYRESAELSAALLSHSHDITDEAAVVIPLLFSIEARCVTMLSSLETGLPGGGALDAYRVNFNIWRAKIDSYVGYLDKTLNPGVANSYAAKVRNAFIPADDVARYHHPATEQLLWTGDLSAMSARIGYLVLLNQKVTGGWWWTVQGGDGEEFEPFQVIRTYDCRIKTYSFRIIDAAIEYIAEPTDISIGTGENWYNFGPGWDKSTIPNDPLPNLFDILLTQRHGRIDFLRADYYIGIGDASSVNLVNHSHNAEILKIVVKYCNYRAIYDLLRAFASTCWDVGEHWNRDVLFDYPKFREIVYEWRRSNKL